MTDRMTVALSELTAFVTALFKAAGLSAEAAGRVAAALIEADLSGKPSHGILQADGYLARLQAGSMMTAERAEIVHERGAAVVMDAANMIGQLAAEHGMEVAVDRARKFGIAAVAMRRGYHFGVAGRYALMAADNGCIGVVMCNTRPVAIAPGGAEKLVGTNPLAIAIPTAGEPPIVFDMATTEGSIGKIRYASAANDPIPVGWAVDTDGNPTTDPNVALKGMLLPMAGAKGFGLSLVIDLMSGLLASGGWGPTLGEMRGDLSKIYNGSSLFIAIDIEHFRDLPGFLTEAQDAAERVRTSRRAPGTDQVFTPGQKSFETARRSDGTITVAPALAQTLSRFAAELDVRVPASLAGDASLSS